MSERPLLPSLHNLSAAPAPTSTGAKFEDLNGDVLEAIWKVLVESGEPETVCRHWSQWCDLKLKEDGLCADEEHADWKEACDLLGNTLADPPVTGGQWPLVITWKQYFNKLCTALWDLQTVRNNHIWTYYILWLKERKKIQTQGGPITGWFKVCAGRVQKGLVKVYGRDRDPSPYWLSETGELLYNMIQNYADPVDARWGFRLFEDTHIGQTELEQKRRLINLCATGANTDEDARRALKRYLEIGFDPRGVWDFLVGQNYTKDKLPDRVAPPMRGARFHLAVEELLKHSAIDVNYKRDKYSIHTMQNNKSKSLPMSMLASAVTRFDWGEAYGGGTKREGVLRAEALATVTMLLEAGADPNSRCTRKVRKRNWGKVGVMNTETEHIEERLLAWLVSEYGGSEHQFAAKSLNLCRLLLEYGADTEVVCRDDASNRILNVAVEDESESLVKLLLEYDAQVYSDDVKYALEARNVAIAAALYDASLKPKNKKRVDKKFLRPLRLAKEMNEALQDLE